MTDSGPCVNRVMHRWGPLLAVGGLLVAAWIAAAFASPQINNLPLPPLRVAGSVSPTPESSVSTAPSSVRASIPEDVTPVDIPNERGGLIAVVTLLVVVAAGGVAGWIVVRRRVAANQADPIVLSRRVVNRTATAGTEVVAAVEAGLVELSDADADPRKAVIACWVRLEQAAAAVGTPRRVADSSTDLVARLLQDHLVTPETLDGLASVYREARYATHTIDDQMRATAVAALRLVHAELGSGRPSGPSRQAGRVGRGGNGDGQGPLLVGATEGVR